MLSQAWLAKGCKTVLEGASHSVKPCLGQQTGRQSEQIPRFSGLLNGTGDNRQWVSTCVRTVQQNLGQEVACTESSFTSFAKRCFSRSLKGRDAPLGPSRHHESRVLAQLPPFHRGRRIISCILFCSGLSASVYAVAALQEEQDLRKDWQNWQEQQSQQGRRLPAWIRNTPNVLQNLYKEFWTNVSPEARAVGGITAVNVLVFLALNNRSHRLAIFMAKNFLHSLPPLPARLVTLCTANFAHKTFPHLAFNSIALWSFGNDAASALGVNQFLAFYVTAGLSSALLSDLGRVRSLTGGISLGASGAVYACFALTAMLKPDAQVVLIILPWFPINIADALNIAIAADLAGVILGWRRFDHFGHLGGALFGLYYALRGKEELWPKFQALAENCCDRLYGRV